MEYKKYSDNAIDRDDLWATVQNWHKMGADTFTVDDLKLLILYAPYVFAKSSSLTRCDDCVLCDCSRNPVCLRTGAPTTRWDFCSRGKRRSKK